MRAVELAKVAAAAEGLRVKRLARRQAIRAGLGAAAGVFALAGFAMLHVAAFVALEAAVRPWLAGIIVLAVDFVIAGILGALAARNVPDRVEQEALAVRQQSVSQMKKAVTFMAVAGEVASLVLRRKSRSVLTEGSRAARLWMLADMASRFVKRR